MEHVVYMTSDVKSGKFYIGKHSRVKNDSYTGSGVWVKKCKQAKINLQFNVVAVCQTEKDAYDFEHVLVKSCKKQYPNLCMNFSDGGVGFPVGHNLGRPSGMLGKKHSEETIKKIKQWGLQNKRGSNHHMFGKKHTQETKIKMSKSHANDAKIKGKKVLCIETNITYDSLASASLAVCGNKDGRNNIRKFCVGKTKNKIYGYTWTFV
jgi:hypothetical protein